MTASTHDLSEAFIAKWGGVCSLGTCERKQLIDPGNVCVYLDGELAHMTCAKRVMRGQAQPLCPECYCYHVGDCA